MTSASVPHLLAAHGALSPVQSWLVFAPVVAVVAWLIALGVIAVIRAVIDVWTWWVGDDVDPGTVADLKAEAAKRRETEGHRHRIACHADEKGTADDWSCVCPQWTRTRA